MTSREIVKRAIHFQNPPRIPYNFDANRTPEDGITYGEDMMWVFAEMKPMVNAMNEWGVVYETLDDSFGEPKIHPLEGKEDIEDYIFPDFSEDWRYEKMRQQIRENKGEKYVLGMLPNGIFQHMIDLFGFMDFMMNLGANLELVEELADRLCDCAITATRKMAECGVDGIITIDDLALQTSMMMKMETFVEIFKPRFQKLYQVCHELNLDTFIHSCGYTIDLLEHLIEAGVQVVNLDQQDNMGIWNLSKRYKGKVCFYCPIDIQRTLDMNQEQIEERVKEMIDAFACENGGFIAKTYPQPRAIKMSDTYLKWMTDAFKKYGQAECNTFYYVSPEGSDQNDGSISTPFKTIEKARDTIREYRELPSGGITVYLREGEYNLEKTFLLTPEDSGQPGRPIIYASYPDENAIITSKEAITGWRKMTEVGEEHLYVADIPTGWRFHFLYDEGKSMPVSAITQSDDWMNWPLVCGEAATKKDMKGRLLTFPEGILDGLDQCEDMECSMSTADWWNINGVITDVDSKSSTARLHSKLTVQYDNLNDWRGGHFNLTNAKKWIQNEGEWAVDSKNGKVYYWPEKEETLNARSIFAPKLHELVRLQGDEETEKWKCKVHDVGFQNLQFCYSDRIPEDKLDSKWLTRNGENPDGMIFMQGVEDITVENCLIAYSGAQGICLDHYSQNCRLIGNEIAYTSSGGIQITGYGPGMTDLNKNHRIQRNHIHHIGLDYMHSNGLQIYGSHHNLTEYNYFHDLPYAAISIIGMKYSQMNGTEEIDTFDSYGNNESLYQARWEEFTKEDIVDNDTSKMYQHSEENIMQYNICDDYLQVMKDGGALYAWCSGGNKLWLNNVGEREETDEYLIRAIHMDDYDVYNTIKGNRFYANRIFDNSQEPEKNIWEDNIITRESVPEGYVELRNHIVETVKKQGGWLMLLFKKAM